MDKETTSTFLRVLSYPPSEGNLAYLNWTEELQSTCKHAYTGSIRVAHLAHSKCRYGHPIVKATFRCGYVHEFSELEMRICINFHNKVCASDIQSFKIQRRAALDEKHGTINDEVHAQHENVSVGSLSNEFPRDDAAQLPATSDAAQLPANTGSAGSLSNELPPDESITDAAQLPAKNGSAVFISNELPRDDAAQLPATTDAALLPANNASTGSLSNELPRDDAAQLPATTSSTDAAELPGENASAGSLSNALPRDDAAQYPATSDAA